MSRRAKAPREAADPAADVGFVHLRVGWWALLIFLSGGIALEALHGFKAGFYLDVGNETRRLLFTLAHAHGTLLAVLNLVFAATLPALPALRGPSLVAASRCLIGALILLPGGFFAGGAVIHDGDPGLGVLLVPPGALLLVVAVFLTARAASARAGE